MDCGACGVAGHGVIIGFADPGHARLTMSAEQVTSSVDTFVPARPRGVGVHRLAVSHASPDLARGGLSGGVVISPSPGSAPSHAMTSGASSRA